MDYRITMVHGGVMILTLLDGLVINRVPVRIKHMLVTAVFGVLYLIWTLFHELVYQYNPYKMDDDTVDATFSLRLQGRQRVGRKFDVEWRAGMRFVPKGETDLSKGRAKPASNRRWK